MLEHIDGFSIGSNDLTQLTLGLDSDSSLVAHLYDERNPAVKQMITKLIESAKRNGVKVGICGQGPSDESRAIYICKHIYELTEFMVDILNKPIKNYVKKFKRKFTPLIYYQCNERGYWSINDPSIVTAKTRNATYKKN